MEKTLEELISELSPEEREIVSGWFDFMDLLDESCAGDPD